MHELSVTEALLHTACETAEKQCANKVTALNIKIGKLSGIVDDSVQFYWDFITKDTICENSILHFTFVPASFKCNQCKNIFEIKDELVPCPMCNGMDMAIIQGDEFLLESIEIEKDQHE